MEGYLDEAGRPATGKDTDGWIYTDDLGTLDDDGFLTVVGRVRDLLICVGFNVYPAVVEAAVNELPGVVDCAVTAKPADRLGEVPVVALIPEVDTQPTLEDLRIKLRARLAGYELPARSDWSPPSRGPTTARSTGAPSNGSSTPESRRPGAERARPGCRGAQGAARMVPPSTARHAPLIQDACSDARNTMAPATSSGVPGRPTAIGALAIILSSTSSADWPLARPASVDRSLIRSVSTRPGITQLARMPSREKAMERFFVKLISAAFEAE